MWFNETWKDSNDRFKLFVFLHSIEFFAHNRLVFCFQCPNASWIRWELIFCGHFAIGRDNIFAYVPYVYVTPLSEYKRLFEDLDALVEESEYEGFETHHSHMFSALFIS